MRRYEDQFQQVNANVVLVGLGSPEETAKFMDQLNIPFPMVADPEKRLYDAFQLERASVKSLFSGSLLRKGLSALAGGSRLGVPKGDVLQLPGVFIIDSEGFARFSHYAKDPADHPDPESLLEALRSDPNLKTPKGNDESQEGIAEHGKVQATNSDL